MNNFGQKSVSDTLQLSKNGPKISKALDDLIKVLKKDGTTDSRMSGANPIDPQDFITKSFLESGFQKKASYITSSNNDITTNINLNTGNFITDVPILGSSSFNNGIIDYEIINNTQIKIKFNGSILLMCNVHMYSNTARVNTNIITKINNTSIGSVGASGYIRRSTGHNESSVHISGIFNVSVNDIVSIGSRREAQGGAVYMQDISTSTLSILRLT